MHPYESEAFLYMFNIYIYRLVKLDWWMVIIVQGISVKKLQLLGLSLNEGLFLTQLRVHKDHAVLSFIRWNVENVRGYEKARRCSFFNKDDSLLMIKRAQLI